jgi:hypothetical protein
MDKPLQPSEIPPDDPNMNKYSDLGGGITSVPIVPPEPVQEEDPLEDENDIFHEEILDRDKTRPYDFFLDDETKKKQYTDEPSYADQYSRYPETVRRVGPTMEVFDLSNPSDALEMNKLMAGAQSYNAPRSMLVIVDRQWCDKTSNWKILAQVYKFKYLKILERD